MSIAIKVENLSKQYRLGAIGTGSISHDLNRWWHTLRGKENPYLKIGETNDRSKKGNSEYVWSLKDINFQIEQGDAVGIIGRNGAGKSTLLKILSRVTGPTTGSLKVKGRIASLLEVGTGFHPELSGRENIFLNGAILGMRKHEIQRKFDEIVDFSGVERYIDTPVKRYSSGMYVRLAFAVAAHLESEILIVDEVLAVGDADFQKKCLGKMSDVSKGEGRTVLFVSHNMGSVKALCTTGIVLKNGGLNYLGNTNNAIQEYLAIHDIKTKINLELNTNRSGSQIVKFADFYLENDSGSQIEYATTGDDIKLVFVLKCQKKVAKVNLGFSLHDLYGDALTNLYSSYQNIKFSDLHEGYHLIKVKIARFPLTSGKIYVKGRIEENGIESDWPKDYLGSIQIEMGDFYNTGNIGAINWNSKFLIKGEWEHCVD
jgi:lipopolysaccharide transport system ATP-binding protein